MANFILARPKDDGTFTGTNGTTAAGLGTSNMIDARVRNVTRFTDLTDVIMTYDTGQTLSSFEDFRTAWIGYSNLTPYRNQLRYPNLTSGWTHTNTSYNAIPKRPWWSLTAGSAGVAEYYASQTTDVPFDGTSGWSGIVEGYYGTGSGDDGTNEMDAVLSIVVGTGADGPDNWVRFGIYHGVALVFGVDWDGTNVAAAEGTETVAAVDFEGRDGINAPRKRIYAHKALTGQYTAGLTARIQFLGSSKETSYDASGDSTGLLEGYMFEYGYGCTEPSDFIDNGATRGPIIRFGWSDSSNGWGNVANYLSMYAGCAVQTPIDPMGSVDIHSLGHLPDDLFSARYVSVAIDDADNTDGYVDIGRLVVADPVQPSFNVQYGIQGPDVRESARRSVRRPVRADRLRHLSMTHSGEAVEAQRLKALCESVGSSGQVLFVKDPTSDFVWRDTMLGYITSFSQTEAAYDWHSTSIQMSEAYETRIG
jgi:hypothetical protein